MASTLAAALAEVEGPRFDAVVGYTVERPEPAPVDEEVAAAFVAVDSEFFDRLVRQLVSQCGGQPADAEEAIQNANLELLMKRPDLFREEPTRWTGLLYETARYRLLDIKERQGETASIEALTEIAGDAPFEKANPCTPLSHDGGSESRYIPPPQGGEEWSQSRIIGALQRFRDYYGRPPKSSDCKKINELPCPTTICRYFTSFVDAVLAAGMVPEASLRRRSVWRPLEAARVCRAFRWRNGRWPSSADARRCRGELPGDSVMIRCFGGTRSHDVQRGAEAILTGVEAKRR